MNINKHGFGILLWLLAMTAAQAAEIAGVKLEDRTRVGARELLLNGAGVRTRAIFKVYVGGLYLTEKKSSAAEVLALPGPKRVSLSLLRDLSSQQITDALIDGIKNSQNPQEMEALQPRVDELAAILKSIGDAKSGSAITLDYLPEAGTQVTYNGAPKGSPIAGEALYRALLRVWLGDKPVDADLKKAMLGQGA
jgi:hypothetical protein